MNIVVRHAIIGAFVPVALFAQEPPATRWSLSAGPTMQYGSGQPWISNGTNYFVTSEDTIVTPSRNAIGHVSLGMSRAISGTALVFRADLLYAHSRGGGRGFNADSSNDGSPFGLWRNFNTRPALRENTLMLGAGLQWDALPGRAWTPYLLTTAGVRYTRLGWSQDTLGTTVDRSAASWGQFVNVGGGIRINVGKREVFGEWRWYGVSHRAAGSRFVPFSFGIRF